MWGLIKGLYPALVSLFNLTLFAFLISVTLSDLCLICGGKDEPRSINDQLTRSRAYLKVHEEDATQVPVQVDTTVESLTCEAKKKSAVDG